MKTVKIMFTAIMAFAVVGGALAFKAQKFTRIDYYTANAANANEQSLCTKTVLATVAGATNPLTVWATTEKDTNCQNIAITTAAE